MNRALVKLGIALVLVALLAGCLSPAAQSQPAYWPTDGWRTTTPEQQGMDSEQLVQMVDAIQEQQLPIHSLLIVRNGYLISEIYAYPYSAGQVQSIASVTKSVIGALVGIAIEQGYIKDVYQPLLSFFPDENISNLDPDKQAITLEDLLTLTAGLDCQDTPAPDKPVMEASQNWIDFMLNLPMASKPGTKFNYCSGVVHLLSGILQKATGMSTRQFANKVLFSQIGIGPISEARWPPDPQGVTIGGYELSLTPQEMAKFGYLIFNRGKWGDKQIIPSEWVTASTTSHIQKDAEKDYGYLWTIGPQEKYYAALGRGGQHIFVYPKENLVVVFTAGLPTGNNADLIPLQQLLDRYILPAVKSAQPLPANPGAQAQFQAGVHALAQPQLSTPSLPATALEISEKTYALNENPFGWQTIVFSFKEGENEAKINVNGLEIAVGLDNTYRFISAGESPFPQGFRGRWENKDTFIVEAIELGLPIQNRATILFSGDTIHIIQREGLSGSEVEVQGKSIDEG